MALSNSQYNMLMRMYEERQSRNRHDRERRLARVYDRIPRIRELDRAMGKQAADCARRVLAGEGDARQELQKELAALRAERDRLLREGGFPEDYTELHYDCPDCRDTGYVEGRQCHCFAQAKLGILYAQSNIREILERENFQTLSYRWYDGEKTVPGLGITELEYWKRVVRQCREFAERFPGEGHSLLFTGATGVGKSFLANCIAKVLIDRRYSVICLSSQDLFELLSRHRFEREAEDEVEETCRHILECDMLIIDDLGTEMNNTFVSSQLFYCVNERISRRKGTIISTNLSLGQLRDAYSDRVTSRIVSHYTVIPLYGSDIRLKKRQTFGV